jgi:hypothetical protein
MAIGSQKEAQTYSTLDDAKAAAVEAKTVVWAVVSGVNYRVLPNGKTFQL